MLPRVNTLLENFLSFAVKNGIPARWYYINKSRGLLLEQIKAMIARDVLGYPAFIEMLNHSDPAVKRAVEALENGESPLDIKLKDSGKGSSKKGTTASIYGLDFYMPAAFMHSDIACRHPLS